MLTPKQENFCLAYLETGNASEAYRRSYNAENMKPETINKRAIELLADGAITGRIAELRKPVEEAAQIDLTRTVKEIVRLAVFDPRKLLNEDGTPKPLSELDDDTAAAVSGVKVRRVKGEDGEFCDIIEYKISDKNAALDKLMKHLGGYEKDNRQKSDAVAAMIQEIAQANTGRPAFPIVGDEGGGKG